MKTLNSLLRKRDGQSLIEAALLFPALLALTFNAVNMGYFAFAFLNLSTATRQGAEYSIQGSSAYQQSKLPTASAVSTVVYASANGAIPGSGNTPVRVCTLANGVDPNGSGTSNQIPLCSNFGSQSGTYTTVQPDPEAPYLVLNRVDIEFKVTAPVQGFLFNLIFPPSLTFHRYVYMRAEN
jgi:Flp pilus assembly protein TadG